MRKYAALFLIVLLALSLPALAEEGDWSLEEILINADPAVVNQTVSGTGTDAENAEDAEVTSIYESDGSVLITITGTGDFTIGGDSRKSTDIFDDELRKQDGDINFTMRNVRDILLADDLTIVNFEGTLTDSTYVPSNKKENQFLFSAPPSYVSMLSDNGVEAVALENNHIMDHGEDAYQDTKDALTDAGIVYSNST